LHRNQSPKASVEKIFCGSYAGNYSGKSGILFFLVRKAFFSPASASPSPIAPQSITKSLYRKNIFEVVMPAITRKEG